MTRYLDCYGKYHDDKEFKLIYGRSGRIFASTLTSPTNDDIEVNIIENGVTVAGKITKEDIERNNRLKLEEIKAKEEAAKTVELEQLDAQTVINDTAAEETVKTTTTSTKKSKKSSKKTTVTE